MAQSAAEKKAKAHEYYMEYRKKGKKKGRKKGTSKKSKGKKGAKSSLLGVTTSGLNTEGTIEAAAIKDRVKKEMNEALGKAKTDDEKLAIRKEYANKANSEIAKLKADPKFAKAKATKSSSKGGGSKSSKSSGKSSTSKSSGSKSSSSTSKATGTSTAQTATEQMTQAVQQMKDVVSQLTEKLLGGADLSGDSLEGQLSKLTPEQRETMRAGIQSTIDAIKKKLGIS